MRKHLWILMMAAFLDLAIVSSNAATPSYDALYVFGDSYCDVGNLFAVSGYPPAPYYMGRFSDGPIWLDHVAGFLHVPLSPSVLHGTDYAFGGAWATVDQPLGASKIPSVPTQVGQYLLQHGGKADPNALYIIEGGGNDIVDTTTGSPQMLGNLIAHSLFDSEQMLRKAGARHFVIPNLFNVGLLPVAATKVAFASAASTAVNKGLNELLAPEEEIEGVHILRMDVFSLMNALQTAPTHFGFIDITDPCLVTTTTPPSLCGDPDHTFFWDTFHPTLFGHAFFAVTLENVLSQQDN
jgi:phospholipase/lecithinase/hemolysin